MNDQLNKGWWHSSLLVLFLAKTYIFLIVTPLLPIVFTGLHNLSHSLLMQSHYSASGRLSPQGIYHSVLTGCQ